MNKGFQALLLMLIGFALGLIVAKSANGNEPKLLAALRALPVYVEDRAVLELKDVQLQDFARAIERASAKPPGGIHPKDWQAALAAVAYGESTLSIRIHRGDCNLKKRECDAGRARGPWQQQKNVFVANIWDQLHGLEFTEVQAEAASASLARGFHTCARSGVPWLQGAINGYMGRRCGADHKALQHRLHTFNLVRRRL
jgi:hypothetical protein